MAKTETAPTHHRSTSLMDKISTLAAELNGDDPIVQATVLQSILGSPKLQHIIATKEGVKDYVVGAAIRKAIHDSSKDTSTNVELAGEHKESPVVEGEST